jgi:hypothetical protein
MSRACRTYEDVYRLFLVELQADAADVCDALDRLEHVFILLQACADAQQVFESLNSTGAPRATTSSCTTTC